MLSLLQFSALPPLFGAVGLTGGFIVVPLNAALQTWAGSGERGHLISTNNFFNLTSVLLSSGALWLLRDGLGIEPRQILLIAGVATLVAILAALWGYPQYAISAAAWARLVLGSALDGRDRRRRDTRSRLHPADDRTATSAPPLGMTQGTEDS